MSTAAVLAATIAFRGATLIDGTGAPAVRDSLLVISDGRIVSVGQATPEALRALPPGTKVEAVSGKWIVPGFVDAHVHADSDEDLKTMLRWGLTSVRVMAEDSAAAVKLAYSSKTRGDIPEVFPAAPIFTAKGGWWDQGEPPDASLDRFADNPERARASVRRARVLGSAEIKLMLDDMRWCRDPLSPLPRMKPDVARALIEEARNEGLRVSVHAPGLSDAKEAIADGATALAHGVLDPIDDGTLAVMKSRPVFYIPTMDIFELLADPKGFVETVLSDPRAAAGVPAETAASYRSAAYAERYAKSYPNVESLKKKLPVLRENIKRLHAAGVPVALGTDMWAFPGLGVSIEMDLYVRAGLTPLEVLRAATLTSARSLDLDKDRGTLAAGKRADFLILDADPTADVRNVRALSAVYKAGVRAVPR
ncbi:MAG TPA: amidohydrolase family protein [Thermoanaerobaculia bacterium]|nr:amidohydrolase family protein [Thermoanaerobaculia bacterium]